MESKSWCIYRGLALDQGHLQATDMGTNATKQPVRNKGKQGQSICQEASGFPAILRCCLAHGFTKMGGEPEREKVI